MDKITEVFTKYIGPILLAVYVIGILSGRITAVGH